jgi:outer membrane translocation and assembly module TamA
MRWNPIFVTLVFSALSTSLPADCIKKEDHRSNKNSGVLVTDFVISGTQSLNSDDLNRIRGQMIGGCYDEDSDELQQYIRALFQNRGYFAVEVKGLNIKPLDTLGVPKPVVLDADVQEGRLFRLGEIQFSGNHAFSAAKLRNVFPLKKGALFERDKIAGGLDSLSNLYGKDGFLDLMSVPDTENVSSGTIRLSIAVEEGPQYRMGKLDVLAKKEIADKLHSAWQLPEGAVFDPSYIDHYVRANRSLFPSEFTRDSVQVIRDCPAALVEVRLPIDISEVASHPLPNSVNCEASRDRPE